MLALLLLGLTSVLTKPYDPQAWSLLAAKWIVPFALFHLAGIVFRDHGSLRKLEIFALVVLAYLTATSILYLAGTKSLIFPRFILDQSLGIHADRARGPFLQAVANGMSLNILGILAISLAQKQRTVVFLLWLALPMAVLATMTRAVWIAFAFLTIALGFHPG